MYLYSYMPYTGEVLHMPLVPTSLYFALVDYLNRHVGDSLLPEK